MKIFYIAFDTMIKSSQVFHYRVTSGDYDVCEVINEKICVAAEMSLVSYFLYWDVAFGNVSVNNAAIEVLLPLHTRVTRNLEKSKI